MLRWQRRTAGTYPNAYYANEGYKQFMHLIVTQNDDVLIGLIQEEGYAVCTGC